ncbi:hypothetical protein [Actinophytocola sediminis]
MSATQETRRRELGILTGSLFVVLWLAGMVVQDMSGADSPRPTDDMATVAGHLRDGASHMERSGGLQILAAVALLWFAAVLAGNLRRSTNPAAKPELALVGGIAAAVTLMVSATSSIAFAGTDLVDEDAFAQLSYQLTFWLGGPIHVAGLGLLIVAAASGLTLPKWLNIAGLVIGTIGLLSSLSPIVYPLVAFTPIGRFLGFLWLLTATVMVALRREPAAKSTVEESARV